jgi:hypothetical protein
MYFRRKTSAGRAYLQIVESRRDGAQIRQQSDRHAWAVIGCVFRFWPNSAVATIRPGRQLSGGKLQPIVGQYVTLCRSSPAVGSPNVMTRKAQRSR